MSGIQTTVPKSIASLAVVNVLACMCRASGNETSFFIISCKLANMSQQWPIAVETKQDTQHANHAQSRIYMKPNMIPLTSQGHFDTIKQRTDELVVCLT